MKVILSVFAWAVCSFSLNAAIPKIMTEKCAPCHGPDLKGQGGVFPNLWETERVKKKDVKAIVDFVIAGSGPESTSIAKMPPKGGHIDLTTQQIEEMAKYLTTNSAPQQNQVTSKKSVLNKNLGPLVGAAIDLGKDLEGSRHIVSRAHVVPLGGQQSAGIVFDSDTMAYSAIWLNGTDLRTPGMPFGGAHGKAGMEKYKNHLLKTGARNGWSHKGDLKDPRVVTYKGYPALGRLPKDWAHFKGHYLYNDKVVFKYSVGEAIVMDSPGLIEGVGAGAVTRTLNIKGAQSEKLILAEATGATIVGDVLEFISKDNTTKTYVALSDATEQSTFGIENEVVYLKVPKGDTKLKLVFWQGNQALLQQLLQKSGKAENLEVYTKGGQPKWPQAFTTVGVVSKDTAAYVVDRLTVPYNNPYEPKMRIGGFDFFSDGTSAAVSTWDGDVWIIQGIDDKLENLTWKRFATSLHEPLGLKIVDDVIYTVGDDQITRFHDVNGDGEADFYENFNNDWELTEGFHAFCFDLHTDKAGDFYFSIGCPVRPGGRGFERMGNHHGSIIKVSRDGQKLSIYASGFRAPNGIGMGPNGQITCGDNEGSFVPAAPIHWVEPGKFHGVVDSYRGPHKLKTQPIGRYHIPNGKEWRKAVDVVNKAITDPKVLDVSEKPKPLAWLSKARHVDNSGGGQVWAGNNWGPLSGELLHLSYGQSSVSLVVKENKSGLMQGGVVKLPLQLSSSAMRARVNFKDGQVYVSGLKGWQTNAKNNGGLDRIRYTKSKLYMPLDLKTKKGQMEIRFSQPLSKASAERVEHYAIKAWGLSWSQVYGSKETPLSGFAVQKAELLSDGKTVRLTIPDLKPVDTMEIYYNIQANDGQGIKGKIDNTIHIVE